MKLMIVHPYPLFRNGFSHLATLLPIKNTIIQNTAYLSEVIGNGTIEHADAMITGLEGWSSKDLNIILWLQEYLLLRSCPLLVFTHNPSHKILPELQTKKNVSLFCNQDWNAHKIVKICDALRGEQMKDIEIESLDGIAKLSLTLSERRVLNKIIEGKCVTQIAIETHRSIKTISAQKRTIMHKLGVTTDVGLFLVYRKLNGSLAA